MPFPPLPEANLENLLPPNRGYKYFEPAQAGQHLFHPTAATFECSNAAWLADASLLAYEDDFARVQDAFLNGGLPKAETFEKDGTRAYLAWNDDFAIVSFRGTRVLKYGVNVSWENVIGMGVDWATDGGLWRVEWDDHRGRVHQGFVGALNRVWTALSARLAELKGDSAQASFPIWFTGHSLGGALATLAADRYGAAQGLYTFGSPCVGDADFCRQLRVPGSYRVVHHQDLVSHSLVQFGAWLQQLGPLRWFKPYAHVEELRYIDEAGDLHTGTSLSFAPPAPSLGEMLKAGVNFRDIMIKLSPHRAFTDHAPLYYAIRLWQNCERGSSTV